MQWDQSLCSQVWGLLVAKSSRKLVLAFAGEEDLPLFKSNMFKSPVCRSRDLVWDLAILGLLNLLFLEGPELCGRHCSHRHRGRHRPPQFCYFGAVFKPTGAAEDWFSSHGHAGEIWCCWWIGFDFGVVHARINKTVTSNCVFKALISFQGFCLIILSRLREGKN